MRLTKSKLYYSGRSIEEGDIRLQRLDSGLWIPKLDNTEPFIDKVLNDPALVGWDSKAEALSPLIGRSAEACRSLLRRISLKRAAAAKKVQSAQQVTDDSETGE